MKKKESKKQQELHNSNLIGGKNKNTQLVEREHVDGTPFTAVKQNEKWFLTLGKYKVSSDFQELEELKKWMETDRWELLTTFCSIIAQDTVFMLNQKK